MEKMRLLMSHNLVRRNVINHLSNKPLYLIVIDNLRYDQWKIIEPVVSHDFRVKKEEIYYSILPTATQYARNAIFSGMLPSEMEKKISWKMEK